MTVFGTCLLLIFINIYQTTRVSYNQPIFCPDTTWQSNAITFTNNSTIIGRPSDIFINTNNSIHVTGQKVNIIWIWPDVSISSSPLSVTLNQSNATTIFTTVDGTLYSGSIYSVGIYKWDWRSNRSSNVVISSWRCYNIFIDINNVLYCSLYTGHKIIAQSISNSSSIFATVAGENCPGILNDRLYNPRGIFVDTNFDLYVADSNNHRIQLFQQGQRNGITVAGWGAPLTIVLNYPSAIALDGKRYIFIVDSFNHRIIASGPTGFRCIVGCINSFGSASHQLNVPSHMAFDSFGNIFVIDKNNFRIQKFLIATNSCYDTSTSATSTVQDLTDNSIYFSFSPSTNSYPIEPLQISYNEPKYDLIPLWSTNAITIFHSSISWSKFVGIFIDRNNTIYSLHVSRSYATVWIKRDNISSVYPLNINIIDLFSLFVTSTGEIFISGKYIMGHIYKFTPFTNRTIEIFNTSEECYDIFIDNNNTFYCSMRDLDQVIAKSLSYDLDPFRIVAGRGCPGSTAYDLHNPHGIFVSKNFELYVADCQNDRVQTFKLGHLNGNTIFDKSTSSTISLNCPTKIALDADENLFIVDSGNNRIIASSQSAWRCVVGCLGIGSTSDRLMSPQSMALDSYGNIFVVDADNFRIQKFPLITNSCDIKTMTTISPTQNLTTTNLNSSQLSKFISYNQPKLDTHASWSPSGFTFSNSSASDYYLYGIYIDINDTVYVANQGQKQIEIWLHGSIMNRKIISSNLSNPYSVFVTINNDIYVDNGYLNNRIDKFQLNAAHATLIMNIERECYDLFIDINDVLYCSMTSLHKVIVKPLNSTSTPEITIAGTGCPGATSYQLSYPLGIFVDINLNLYVADCDNNRVQLFPSGQSNGKTIVDKKTFQLRCPSDIILDGNGDLFIVDNGNHRIIVSGLNGLRCIIGCPSTYGSQVNQLFSPMSIAFDSHGNLFVTDTENRRIQKFVLLNNSVVPFYNQPKLCNTVAWDPNATTLANYNYTNFQSFGIFVDLNNTIYVSDVLNDSLVIWFNKSTTQTFEIKNVSDPRGIFVTTIGDIYVGHTVGLPLEGTKLQLINRTPQPFMSMNGLCHGLFIDTSNTIYCSMGEEDRVVKKWLDDGFMISTTVAGSIRYQLRFPLGIFVDINFDLYVADCGNDRIMRFPQGHMIGIPMTGSNTSGSISLNCPSGVLLDADKNMFIVDSKNSRIVTSGPSGFQCIVGCLSAGGSSNQLNNPKSMAFDSHGNIFVTDFDNKRIQKYSLKTDACVQKTTMASKLTSAITSISSVNPVSIGKPFAPYYVTKICSNHSMMGIYCNLSASPCAILQPCQNGGTCMNVNVTQFTYACICPRGFNGTECQFDNRICTSQTCWNNGTCNETSNSKFECICNRGWAGIRCELKINYCENVTCLNYGRCRPLYLNYTCDCLGSSFSGRHCEIISQKQAILRIVSTSIGYIGISMLVAVISFVTIMDIIKYIFNIDLLKNEKRWYRRKPMKTRPVIQRFVYIN